jgi:hypothetical protein
MTLLDKSTIVSESGDAINVVLESEDGNQRVWVKPNTNCNESIESKLLRQVSILTQNLRRYGLLEGIFLFIPH